MALTLLERLKLYFNITDTSKDDILNLIIDSVETIQEDLKFDSSLVFSCCIEDYSNYLKSGSSAFKVSQASYSIGRYSAELSALIARTSKVGVF